MRVEGFRVRVAEAADVAGVVALEREIAEAPHWAEAEYVAMIQGDDAVKRCLFVAEAEDEGLVGFAVGKVIGSGAESLADLESVAVVASARRGGVGKALCGAVVDWCSRLGAAVLELEVRAGSGGAIALYSRLGFVVTGRRKEYYRGPVEDALLMRLDLISDQ